jgi:hypothetical protein
MSSVFTKLLTNFLDPSFVRVTYGMASGGSTVVEHSTINSESKSLNPATDRENRKKPFKEIFY